MNTTKVVIREVQGDRGFQMRQLLAERIGEPRKAPKLHSHGQVLPFYKAGRNVPRIRIASPHLGYNLDDWAWGVPPSRITAPCGVPSFVSDHRPSSDTPALSHFRIRRSTRRSATRCSMNFIVHAWLRLSKKPRMSASSTQFTRFRWMPTVSASSA